MEQGAVLYDFLQVKGGAERVTLTLAHGLPGVDLCIGFRNTDVVADYELEGLHCIDLHAKSHNIAWRAVKTIRAFRDKTHFLSRYAWVLYSGNYAPVAVQNHLQGRNILYCHTIPRFAYDLRDYYLHRCPLWQRPALRALIAYVRPRYEAAVSKMDVIIANSHNIRQRIKQFLGRDAMVIYPPCEDNAFRWLSQGNYYLSLARLEPLKRVELIVEAFCRMPEKRLVVASGGSELMHLRRIARGADNIHFTGWTNEARLRELIGHAIATLYLPKDEDFGMSPVESMAAGKPVIGVAEGGLLETILPDETGLLLPPDPYVENIIQAVQILTPRRALEMRHASEARAKFFDKDIFLEKMRAIIG